MRRNCYIQRVSTLAYELLPAKAEQQGHALFLHGVFGRGPNLRTLATRYLAARPQWSGALVDLRMHGKSQQFPPPHTLDTAAEDLRALTAALPLPTKAIVAHSFGGKVALLHAARAKLDELWLLDSPPYSRVRNTQQVENVLVFLEGQPPSVASRSAFAEAAQAFGLSALVARWLAGSLQRSADGRYELCWDTQAIRQMFADYLERDLWEHLEVASQRGTRVVLVVAGSGSLYSDEARCRAAQLAVAGRVEIVEFPASGHWVHLDALNLLSEAFAS